MKTHISSLKEFNTFGIDVLANNFNKAKNEDEILHFLIENKCNMVFTKYLLNSEYSQDVRKIMVFGFK